LFFDNGKEACWLRSQPSLPLAYLSAVCAFWRVMRGILSTSVALAFSEGARRMLILGSAPLR
jgi:hypothetical protein